MRIREEIHLERKNNHPEMFLKHPGLFEDNPPREYPGPIMIPDTQVGEPMHINNHTKKLLKQFRECIQCEGFFKWRIATDGTIINMCRACFYAGIRRFPVQHELRIFYREEYIKCNQI